MQGNSSPCLLSVVCRQACDPDSVEIVDYSSSRFAQLQLTNSVVNQKLVPVGNRVPRPTRDHKWHGTMRMISARRSDLPFVADREARGLGVVMFAEEIEKFPVYNMQDILQFYSRFSLGQRRRVIMVDGRPIRGSWEIPHKLDIAAMEAQRGFLGVNEPDLWLPNGVSRTTGATVLLIWTKPYIEWQRQQAEKQRARDGAAHADSATARMHDR